MIRYYFKKYFVYCRYTCTLFVFKKVYTYNINYSRSEFIIFCQIIIKKPTNYSNIFYEIEFLDRNWKTERIDVLKFYML